jgi:hypothetical protein
MKRIFLFLFILLSFKSYSQVSVVGYITTQGVALYPTHYDSMGFAGYRVAKDTTERDAITCLRRKFGMAVYVQSVNKIYILKDSSCNNVWEQFSSGGSSIDTTSLSNRINSKADTNLVKLKLNASDTISLSNRINLKLNASDTISLSNRINLKVNISDTGNKYVNAIAKNTTKDSIIFYIGTKRYAIKDSSGVSSGSDTISLSNRINQKLNISDTTAFVRKTRSISTTSPLQGGGSLNGDLTLSMPYVSGGSGSGSIDGYLRYSDYLPLTQKVSPSTTISTTSPLGGGGNLGGNLTLTIQQASITTPGYITSSDYSSFASKQGGLTPISPIQISGSLLSSRKASATDSGYLSATDWNTFNNKLSTSDTTNKFVNNVIKLNDSTISVYKGTSFTNITLSPSTTVAAATRLVTTVYNNSGSTIAKGSVVYINGRHSSNYPTIAKAQANTEDNSYSTFAVVQDDILNNSTGTVIQAGNISNLNLPTSTYTDGQLVYLSPTVAGGITTTKPLAPNHIVKIGTVTRAHPTLGSIELKIENGWQLDELSDVTIAAVPADSTILQFSRVDSLWHDVNPTTAMGNRFVKNISRVAGKDSIIFTIGSTRYAIKDSVGGGGGGTPAGSNGYVQFNNSSSFGGDSSLFWNNSNKRLGVGTKTPKTKLDVIVGTPDDMPRNYEIANFTKNGDTKLGVFTADTYASGSGSSITLGNSKNLNADGYYPGFEFQNVNDSGNNSGYVRYNYIERGIDGNVALAAVDLFTIESNGAVRMQPTGYGLSPTPRLIVGSDATGEAMLETSGNAFIGGSLTTTSSRIKLVTTANDDGVSNYDVESYDHIIIFSTNNGNSTITLPASPENGRELIIKQAGNIGDYTLIIDANGSEIEGGFSTVSIDQSVNSASVTLIYYDTIWYPINGHVLEN